MQGRADEADEVEHGELARTLAIARLSAPDAVDETAIFAAEDNRVADAAVLAELLVPWLARHFQPSAAPTPEAEPSAATPVTSPSPPAAIRDTTAGVPALADLIDGMLAQERTVPRGRR